MSIAGLRFGADGRGGALSTPHETKSGSYIYSGDPAGFHDWEFRTRLRIRCMEEAVKAKEEYRARASRPRTPQEPEEVEEEEEEEFPFPFPMREEESPPRRPQARSPVSPTAIAGVNHPSDRTSVVHKVLEGLRGDAFLVARDLGLEKLISPGGLDLLVDRIRAMVFPRASEEARELFRAGQKIGVLSRQYGESITSYISRRRRWWRTLQELDPSIALSESMRVELMLKLSVGKKAWSSRLVPLIPINLR